MTNGDPDPLDFRVLDLCEKCGGGGAVLVDLAGIIEKPASSFAIDPAAVAHWMLASKRLLDSEPMLRAQIDARLIEGLAWARRALG